ncbi:SDR family NAD(P)-dependent oxidoreductase [Microvirga sp. SRT01]|uniref:SDR family NAD(P)-dependent oxidoreductase n=1 Tax=Sphingomonas longa TaxID=2778730 RepID=A0ABS2D4T3_9SPHN|nr:SDR family NAD(P)-dependent oxidoreductase [Sphingomonas sp. BT552]MBR7708968.1 SDR family NAD(P)-dependent oxidoreductase [Microvirga sp. SRT01]
MTESTDAHTAVTPLQGRRAIVTGGTTGIGRAIAVLLAAEGAKVFVGGTSPEHLEDALARIREVGEGDGTVLDLAVAGNAQKFVEAGEAYLGGLDIAVMNAAVAAEGLTDMSEDEVAHAWRSTSPPMSWARTHPPPG